MTKFKVLQDDNSKEEKKTVFNHIVSHNGLTDYEVALTKPEEWDNVLHLGFDSIYGDVFKVWNDTDNSDFTLYFGEKGDEFN